MISPKFDLELCGSSFLELEWNWFLFLVPGSGSEMILDHHLAFNVALECVVPSIEIEKLLLCLKLKLPLELVCGFG